MTSCANCSLELPPGVRFCLYCGSAMPSEMGATHSDPFIGRVLRGVYCVQRRIGGGRTSDVYEARHVQLQLPIALKVVKKALLLDHAAMARFEQDARAASRLRHPNVSAILDFGRTDDGALFIAMEYVPGRTLARVVADEAPLSEQRAVRIGEQILSALAEAHARRIVHRNLTPGNVMLAPRRDDPDVVKVLDLGLASLGSAAGHEAAQASLGSAIPGHPPPPGRRADEVDAGGDLHAVGVILYRLLTGDASHEAELRSELVLDRLRGGGVSPALEAFVVRAISADPSELRASADHMRDELLSCSHSSQRTAHDARPATSETELFPSASAPERNAPAESTPARDAAADVHDVPPERGVDPDPGPRPRGGAARHDMPDTDGVRPSMRLGASRGEIGSVVMAGAALSVLATAALAHFVSGDGAPGLRATAVADASAGRRLELPADEPPARALPGPIPEDIHAPPPSRPADGGGRPARVERSTPLASAAVPSDRPARRDEERRGARVPSLPSREQLGRAELCSQLLLRETLGEPLAEPQRRTIERECRR